MKIVIPSKGRPDQVSTTKILNDCIIVCPPDELDLYKEHNPENEIIALPSGVHGISSTRQVILDKFKEVFMIDDDVLKMSRLFEEETPKMTITDPTEILEVIEFTREMAKDLGAKMYGFTHDTVPVHHRPWNPYEFNHFICASGCGYLEGHGLKENPDIVSADDYWMCCLNIYKNRFMFCNWRYAFVKSKNFQNKGGLQGIRNAENMKSDTLILKEHFGDVIKTKVATSDKKKLIEGERSLSFPL
jgi:hypothetical protein